jgi:hypothetical protein
MDPEEAVQHVDAMARARELLGLEIGPPSRELQSRVLWAAVQHNATVTWKKGVDGDGHVAWYAIVETSRGKIVERVQTTWEDAWRATGLLD